VRGKVGAASRTAEGVAVRTTLSWAIKQPVRRKKTGMRYEV
jgi:hypothetical protein